MSNKTLIPVPASADLCSKALSLDPTGLQLFRPAVHLIALKWPR